MKFTIGVSLVGLCTGTITFIIGTTMIPTGSNEGTQQNRSAEEYMNQQNKNALGSYGFRVTMAGVCIVLISIVFIFRTLYLENRETVAPLPVAPLPVAPLPVAPLPVAPLPASVPLPLPMTASVPVPASAIEVIVDNRPRVMTSPSFGALGPLGPVVPPSSHSSGVSPQFRPATPFVPFRPLRI